MYQSFIADSKMWEAYTIPKAFMVYSVASIITLFFSLFSHIDILQSFVLITLPVPIDVLNLLIFIK